MNLKTLSTLSLVTSGYLVITPKVFAQNLSVPKPAGFEIVDLGLLISRLLSIALMVAGVLVFIYLVWGGIQWITSGGDSGKTEEARNRITAALVGLAIVAAAWAVMLLVQYFFGINVFGGGSQIPQGF